MCLTRTTLQSGGRAIQRTRRGPPRRDRGRETEEEQDKGGGSSLASLFSQTGQDEESGISTLLELVPETTVQELLGDLEEIKGILRGRLPES